MRVIWGPRQYIALKCFQLTFGTKEKWESSVSFPVLKQKRVNRGFFRARSTTSLKLPHHNSNCCSNHSTSRICRVKADRHIFITFIVYFADNIQAVHGRSYATSYHFVIFMLQMLLAKNKKRTSKL